MSEGSLHVARFTSSGHGGLGVTTDSTWESDVFSYLVQREIKLPRAAVVVEREVQQPLGRIETRAEVRCLVSRCVNAKPEATASWNVRTSALADRKSQVLPIDA